MSYDVSIGNCYLNYTYNLSRFFHDHIANGDVTGIQALHGLTGKQAVLVLGAAQERIHRTYLSGWTDGEVGSNHFTSIYDSDNGWGSTAGAIIFLMGIMAACSQNPRHKVHVA